MAAAQAKFDPDFETKAKAQKMKNRLARKKALADKDGSEDKVNAFMFVLK